MEPITFNGRILIFLLGAAQGVFLAAVLASRRRHSVPNRLLAVAMGAFALDLGMAAYHASGYEAVVPHLIGLDVPLAFVYGPLLYLYARTLAGRLEAESGGLRRTDAFHFGPFVAFVLFLLPFYALSGAEKLALLHDPDGAVWTRALSVINPLKLAHALVYVGLIIVLLRRHRVRLRERLSSEERVTLNWLRNLTLGIVALTVFTGGLYVLSAREPLTLLGMDPSVVYDDYTLIGLAVLVYAIGYFGLRQPEIFGGRARAAHGSPSMDVGEGARPEQPRYARSGLDPEAAHEYLARLLEIMEADAPYRRGDLKLSDLAEALGISEHNLTEVLSTQVGQSFYDFVNGYRVREVQARLRDPGSGHLTLLAIGLEAGFNSKSSFNAVFKKHTHMTPSQYRDRVALAP